PIGSTTRAGGRIGDRGRRHAGALELQSRRGGEVDERDAVATGDGGRGKPGGDVVADTKAARADTRAEIHASRLRGRAGVREHRGERRVRHAGDGAAPARVGGRDDVAGTIEE